ncbi:hypothetical protein RISK_004966 [Rhodopirellula islandica]|uniref:Uncharacterized protein n=1 Tax=Rhodopirellula islandica TaxID=595434 RepID=A0A0J1B966_RHOIS|nr:hypothetical protein RISK_004966 [Rhodopirellula islandica]
MRMSAGGVAKVSGKRVFWVQFSLTHLGVVLRFRGSINERSQLQQSCIGLPGYTLQGLRGDRTESFLVYVSGFQSSVWFVPVTNLGTSAPSYARRPLRGDLRNLDASQLVEFVVNDVSTHVGWALLPVGVADVGQEWPTYDEIHKRLRFRLPGKRDCVVQHVSERTDRVSRSRVGEAH